MVMFQYTETGEEGHFKQLYNCIIQEFLPTRKMAPPLTSGHQFHHPLAEERLIIQSGWSPYRKFTGTKTNCTVIFRELFPVKLVYLIRRKDVTCCMSLLHILTYTTKYILSFQVNQMPMLSMVSLPLVEEEFLSL